MLLIVGTLLATLAPATPTRPHPSDCSLFYADSSSAWLKAPDGWVLDCEAGKHQGAIVVAYRRGESWQNGKAVMYLNAAANHDGVRLTVDDAMREDSVSWTGNSDDVIIRAAPALRTKAGDAIQVRRFQSEKYKSYEAVAYVPCTSGVWLVVLTARSPADFDAAYPDFAKLVASYEPGPAVAQEKK
jgi:hypothetical protein